jgi:hypothetical protein
MAAAASRRGHGAGSPARTGIGGEPRGPSRPPSPLAGAELDLSSSALKWTQIEKTSATVQLTALRSRWNPSSASRAGRCWTMERCLTLDSGRLACPLIRDFFSRRLAVG